jgi:small-conductance mechanosensitive channel
MDAAILAELAAASTLSLILGFVATAVLTQMFARAERRRLLTVAVLLGLQTVLVLVAAAIGGNDDLRRDLRLMAMVLGTAAGVGMAGIVLFAIALPRIGWQVPRILRDVITAGLFLIVTFSVGSRAGVNVSGLIATSAVLTAVIGLALQDSIGNIFGGLMLQVDESIKAGDWIKVGDVSGKVIDVRWRFTAVETRNWETLIVPNNYLVKNQVLVLGRRAGQPHYWRRWVWFNIDYRYSPTEVISAVMASLHGATIPRVAADPKPNCILMEFHESYARYAVRYWLTDLAVDDPTDSEVRTRIYFALRRARIPLSLPAQSVFLTDEQRRAEQESKRDHERRLAAVHAIGLFKALSEEDLGKLATSLRYSPFTVGETLTKQGAEAHWLYTVVDGRVSVRVNSEGVDHEVAQLGPGDFFGEMSLLTGAPRTATVVALTDVECFRLDKPAFTQFMQTRPELAVNIAEILAERQTGLDVARHDADEEARAQRIASTKRDLLNKVRDFFGLDEEAA